MITYQRKNLYSRLVILDIIFLFKGHFKVISGSFYRRVGSFRKGTLNLVFLVSNDDATSIIRAEFSGKNAFDFQPPIQGSSEDGKDTWLISTWWYLLSSFRIRLFPTPSIHGLKKLAKKINPQSQQAGHSKQKWDLAPEMVDEIKNPIKKGLTSVSDHEIDDLKGLPFGWNAGGGDPNQRDLTWTCPFCQVLGGGTWDDFHLPNLDALRTNRQYT